MVNKLIFILIKCLKIFNFQKTNKFCFLFNFFFSTENEPYSSETEVMTIENQHKLLENNFYKMKDLKVIFI